ncbi:iron chelate uptake ABC transporter family permease subunit [Halocola ammonii]
MKTGGKRVLLFSLLIFSVVVFAVLELVAGSVHIPLETVFETLFGSESVDQRWQVIIFDSRMTRVCTAALAGSSLAVSGLLMQTFFSNPLAGPSVLGITSGSSLGVALLVLAGGGALFGFSYHLSIALAAIAGAFLILIGVMLVAQKLRDNVSLLIFGLMAGYLTSAIVTVLQSRTTKEALQVFVHWGFGTFSTTSWSEIGFFAICVLLGLLLVLTLLKSLNAWMLGEDYAETLGVSVRKTRILILVATGILTGVTTAFCGPIAFLGLAVPHLVRGLFHSADHKILIPGVILTGMVLGLGCDWISRMPWSESSLPLNAVTSLVGAPVVIWIIFMRNRRRSAL